MIRTLLISLLLAAALHAAPPVAGLGAGSPQEIAQMLNDGTKSYNDANYEQAVKLLEDLTQKQPTLAEAFRMLGHSYYQLNRPADARRAFLSALTQGRLTADMLARLVQIDQAADRTAALNAEAALLSVLEPEDRQWQMLRADQLLLGGAAAESLVIYQSLQRGHTSDAALWVRIGNSQLKGDHRTEAALAFETAFHLGDRTANLPRTIAELHLRAEDPLAAAAWFARAAELEPAQADAMQLRRAQALIAAARPLAAEQVAATLTGSKDVALAAKAHLLLGRIAYEARRNDQAVEHWTKALAAGHDDPQLRAFLGAAAFNAGRYAQAAEHLLPLTRGPEPEADHLRFAAESLIRTNRPADARPLIHRYLELFGYDDKAAAMIRSLAAAK
jgi:Flp pilus assembly protein TadD